MSAVYDFSGIWMPTRLRSSEMTMHRPWMPNATVTRMVSLESFPRMSFLRSLWRLPRTGSSSSSARSWDFERDPEEPFFECVASSFLIFF